jgi:hypothetical protein
MDWEANRARQIAAEQHAVATGTFRDQLDDQRVDEHGSVSDSRNADAG